MYVCMFVRRRVHVYIYICVCNYIVVFLYLWCTESSIFFSTHLIVYIPIVFDRESRSVRIAALKFLLKYLRR